MLDASVGYECAAYREQAPIWQLLADVYQGDTAWIQHLADGTRRPGPKARKYLPQMPGEESDEYVYRLLNSHFSDRFAQTCRDFVGLIFNNGLRLVDVPPLVLESWASLDGSGMLGDRFCSLVALDALRFGHSFVLVDFPPYDDSIQSLADSQAAQRTPYWRRISPLQIINWRYHRYGGRVILDKVVIRQTQTVPVGPYGEMNETTYLVLTPGRYDTYQLVKERGQTKTIYLADRSGIMGRRLRGTIEPLSHIPLVCLYGGDRTGAFQSNPTLLSLAKLNLTHYQVASDHRQKMHFCCFPTPVRVGGQGEDIAVGPRRVLDVPLGGSFGWSEPNSQSLMLSRQEMRDLETEMDFLGADYLAKPSDRQAAMTSMIAAQKIESELLLFATDFAAGLTECLRHHAHWLGLPDGGRAELQTKFFDSLVTDPQLLLAYLRMRELETISDAELRELATKANYIPDTMTLGELQNESV